MLDPKVPKQFAAVAYCISQIVQTAQSAHVAVACGLVPTAVSLLNAANGDADLFYEQPFLLDADEATQAAAGIVGPAGSAVLVDGVSYLWVILLNLSLLPDVVDRIVTEKQLFQQTFKESQKQIEVSSSGAIATGQLTAEVLQCILNFSAIPNLGSLLQAEDLVLLAQAAKKIFVNTGPGNVLVSTKLDALTAMINLSVNIPPVRKVLLGDDLISILESAGISNVDINRKFVALVSVISTEESCCVRLIDLGAQRLLVTLQDSMDDLGKDLSAAALQNSKSISSA